MKKYLLLFRRQENLFIAAIFALFLLFYYPIYKSLYAHFSAVDSYYSHGFLVPFLSLFLIWRKRKTLKSIKPAPQVSGLFIFIAGVLLHLLSLFLKVNFSSYFSIPIVLTGIVLYLGGKNFLKELLFPIGFIIFMLPLPKVAIIAIAFKLKMIAAQTATALAGAMGLNAWLSGSTIYYPKGYLLVGDPCSGMRSMISFLALGALFTQFTNASKLRKSILFISTIPIALLSNIARLTFLLLVSYIYGEKAALGFVHDFSGIMVFVLGFFGFIAVAKLLKCNLTANNS